MTLRKVADICGFESFFMLVTISLDLRLLDLKVYCVQDYLPRALLDVECNLDSSLIAP